MSRITKAFATKAKVAYLTAGDGADSAEYFLALARAGANVLEVGIPFSDPVADGPTIQLAMERALKNNTDIPKVVEIVHTIRQKTDAAIILFTYFNPVCKHLADFLSQAKTAGADGVLVVDLPYEEAAEFRYLCAKYDLAPIAVASASTPLSRIEILANHSDGFLYYACRKGTTGIRNGLPMDLATRIQQIKQHSKLPVAVGFGISNNEMVQQVLEVADGCVIGSYFVDAVAQQQTPPQLEIMAREIFHVN